MAYQTALQALADPTRREILERLRPGPLAVGELAKDLPVSRPAVSQHLRVLKDAGLVHETRAGTRRLYGVEVRGLAELRRYLDTFWGDVLQAFKAEAEGPVGTRAPGAPSGTRAAPATLSGARDSLARGAKGGEAEGRGGVRSAPKGRARGVPPRMTTRGVPPRISKRKD